ncbi:MAG TPA: ABC transporter permease [Methanothrix sp.]|nr:ABC transporter permease [Methanothrix sp.]HOV82153.1 ABC transporter permease [Methanothrix sp.]HPC90048.1 ABC transporter permease [Methanothrix sp.]HQE87806.1 ABC transporter permease [Methanothrix sp.]HQI68353.1 ABC transporter permease [Methanothrix sp.]
MREDLNAIYSIWLREMLRFFRLKSRLIGSIASPFFFLAFLGIGFGGTMPGIPSGLSYVSFLTPGIIGMTLLFSATFAGLSVLWDREFGFLKEIMVAPVSRIAIVLGRTAGGLTTGILQAIIILISGILLGMKMPSLAGLLLSLVYMVLVAATFIGLGLAFASKMEDMSGYSLIMNILIFPLFFLSGALFPIERFPELIRDLAYLNPLTYGVDGLRYGLIGTGAFSPLVDLGASAICCVSMLLLGAYLFESTEVK